MTGNTDLKCALEMNNLKISIVIVNWNGITDTLACINSLLRVSHQNCEIIVVDNGSRDQSVEKLRNTSNITLLELPSNLGFPAGSNVGISHALEKGADYIFLLNNDTIVHPAVLSDLMNVMENDFSLGMAGPKIYYLNEPERIWFAGASIDFETGESPHWGKGDLDVGQYDKTVEVDRLSGCAMMVKADVIKKVGLLDPNYFLYYEDVDWCVRAGKAGYKIVCVQTAKIWHKESASTKANLGSSLHTYYHLRNKLLFLRKHSKTSFQAQYRCGKVIVKGAMRFLLGRHQGGRSLDKLRGLADFILSRFGKKRVYHKL
ncbi:MAG: glycosyltransferase family 2 protein [Nitrospirae bacterium]|nr:glycosyltransferase family 2 protein [Candidatus Manganitrophaceae bacterium]